MSSRPTSPTGTASPPSTSPEPAERPPFILSASDVPEDLRSYPDSDEPLAYKRAIGKAAGLTRLGLNLLRVPPGHRSTWPHAEEDEEEFVYVIEGEIDMWVDGRIYPMRAGDLAAFPAGTGICHASINNSDREALLLIGGEAMKSASRIYYPLHPERQAQLPAAAWWTDIPLAPQGPHDGLPDALREKRRGSGT